MTIEPKEIPVYLQQLLGRYSRPLTLLTNSENPEEDDSEIVQRQLDLVTAVQIAKAQKGLLAEARDRLGALLQGDSLCSVDEKLLERITAALEVPHEG